jgi:hypothetical protein
MKVMLIVLFDIKAIVHFEFIPQDQTANQVYYVEVLKQLCEAVHRKGSELWPNDWNPYHDNAPALKALSGDQLLAQKSIIEGEHPPYSLYLAPNDFWLLSEVKLALNGRKFEDIENKKM